MRSFETNNWIMLNNIIYKIHTTEKLNLMRRQFLEDIRMLIDFDEADFYLASKDGSHTLVSPVLYNCTEDEDMSEKYDAIDYSRGILYGGNSLVYRETDIISDEARIETEYYQKVYKPNHWHFALQMVMAMKKEFVGVVTLYRITGKADFEYDDIFILDMLKDHMAYRLYQNKKNGSPLEEKITVSVAVEKYQLTRREHTILKALMNGQDNYDICDALAITNNTLKKHILNIYRKMGINNRVQLFKMVKEKE
ncbi:MAG: helix-turn-helix domain-containing protein [Coprococcus sp.]